MLYVKLLPVVSAPTPVAKTAKVSLPAATSVAVEASSADMELFQTPMSVSRNVSGGETSVCSRDSPGALAAGGGLGTSVAKSSGGRVSPEASVSSCVCVEDHGVSAAGGGGGVEGISVPGAVSTSVGEVEDLLENQLLISESD